MVDARNRIQYVKRPVKSTHSQSAMDDAFVTDSSSCIVAVIIFRSKQEGSFRDYLESEGEGVQLTTRSLSRN